MPFSGLGKKLTGWRVGVMMLRDIFGAWGGSFGGTDVFLAGCVFELTDLFREDGWMDAWLAYG